MFAQGDHMRQAGLVALAVATMAVSVCDAQEFDFRDADRPPYDQRLSVDELSSDTIDVTLLDVRLIEDFEADPQLSPGADYRNPETITAWVSELPKDKPVVVYCVRGKWVSQKAADYLSKQGLEVYSLEGGIEAWKQAQSK